MKELSTLLKKLINKKTASIISYISGFFITDLGIKKYRLNKEYNAKNIKDLKLSPIINNVNNKIDNSKIIRKRLREEIIEFIHVIKENFDNEDLKLFYKNINDVDIKIIKKLFKKKFNGYYTIDENSIHYKIGKETTIYHELFHLSSSTTTKGICYSGFNQINTKTHKSTGKGLNEGYTQLLTERYFNYVGIKPIYIYEKFIAQKVEEIIGKETMEKLYLHADLLGLMDELEKYITQEEIYNFINKMDFINSYRKHAFISNRIKNMLQDSINYITIFMIKIFISKNKDNPNFKEKLTHYINSFNTNYTINNKDYNLLPKEKVFSKI